MKNLQEKLVNILRAEVKPALGCTEPVAVALACAKATATLGEDVVKCTIGLSPNVYKNGMCVGIPGTDRLGLKISAAMGLIGGKSENGLRVLETLTKDDVKVAEDFMDNNDINISPIDTDEKVYIEVILEGKNNTSKVVIRTKHDNIVFVQKNDDVLLNEEVVEVAATSTQPKENILDTITIKEIVKAMETVDFEEIKFLLDGITMNEEIAKYGLNEKVGVGVG
ncbi:MAG: serine dehydratase subunit alpha family protein, partial [Paeniclostridium sp.]